MKIKLLKNKFFFDFLIAVFLTVTLIPLNLTSPEDDFAQAANVNQYQGVFSDYSLYSTIRAQSRAGDINDQYFSKNFALECFQQLTFDSCILFTEQSVTSKLLSYRLISLPPPFLVS
jgi:hypothetical protein